MEDLLEQITTEDLAVEYWRESELERAGYPPEIAAKLAITHHVDLHDAINLVKQGCDPVLAERILV